MSLTPAEQLMLELLNRARLDPLAEAARFGIALNEGLPGQALDGTAKQVLAPNALLRDTATTHSQWMLDNNEFSHEGPNNNTPAIRAAEAGYIQTGWLGENLSLLGNAGGVNLNTAIVSQHEQLFHSPGHRRNILDGNYEEVGIAQLAGTYNFPPHGIIQASMVTQVFAQDRGKVFVTGVIYADRDADDFYSIGEGQGGYSIAAQGGRPLANLRAAIRLALIPVRILQ